MLEINFHEVYLSNNFEHELFTLMILVNQIIGYYIYYHQEFFCLNLERIETLIQI